MNKIILCIALLLCQLQAIGQSQSRYDCLYEYTVKASNGNREVYSTILQIGSTSALFSDYLAFQLDSLRQTKSPDEQIKMGEARLRKSAYFFDQTVFQNTPKGKLSVYSTIIPNHYTYQEDKVNMVWEIDDSSTDTISGYLCRKATAEYGGRSWVAWYAPDIPLQFGPWKFTSLPGLILKVYDSEHVHCFEAIQLRKANLNIVEPQYGDVISTTRTKFLKAKNSFEENPMANLPPESITDMVVMKGDSGRSSILINGMQLRLRENGYIPIEKE